MRKHKSSRPLIMGLGIYCRRYRYRLFGRQRSRPLIMGLGIYLTA